ncbi:uncharacterized protein LOC128206119 isoform X3 [Mya arenaria]|uniref:uncharacterized protein LOC128206119 isoform X3 n=1 Tax=Mya arenaria TaxID=6604 RepID=UPI0022E3FD57|nr:uncharacterized protein LOC128206119 isoform X3 [Mya arenaria]
MERPMTYKSGKSGKSGLALQSNYSVQHRSDILIEEQVDTVHASQLALKKALTDLDLARGEEELEKCQKELQEAKTKTDKAILVLQVLTKVNTELQYARAELEEALDKQEGDINEARKRVMWLEDRMGLLCGKARLRGQPYTKPKKSHRSPERSLFQSRLGTASDSDSDEGFSRGQAQKMGRGRMNSSSESGSDYPAFPQQQRMGMADTPSSDGGGYMMAQQQYGAPGRGVGDSDSESDDEGIPPPLHGMPGLPPISGPVVKHQVAAESPISAVSDRSDMQEEGPASIQHMAPPPATATGGESPASMTESQSGTEFSGQEQGYYQNREEIPKEDTGISQAGEGYSLVQREDSAVTAESSAKVIDQQAEEETNVMEQSEGDLEPERSEVSEKSEMSERSESARSSYSEVSQNQQDPTFMTQIPKERSVTIMTPKRRVKESTKMTTEMSMEVKVTEEQEEDCSRDYWLSEHHRFEYSEYSDVLLEIDPLSYHNVGLAMPGSFIPKPSKSFEALPWRSKRKGSDINDIHKIALDKLAGRVHHLYDKFYDASLLSVRPTPNNEGKTRESTLISNFDNTRDGARSGTPPGMVTAPPTTADGMSRPQTVMVEIKPSKIRPGLNVYHPKPIPPPEVLPLTRTSKDKEYPQLSNRFVDADDFLTHKPAVRIVDQRQLYKETKLRLYRDKPKKEEEGPSTMEKKFRMMLEQEKSMTSRSGRSSQQTSRTSSRSSTGKTRENSATLSTVSKSVSVVGKPGAPSNRMSVLSRAFTKAETAADSEAGASIWSKMKPSSRGKEYSGLKWERVKTLVHVQLVSRRPEERRDAAKHLGVLRCGDAMVFFALKERVKLDEDSRTRYEAAKSLILLGCWDEDVLQVILKYLVVGNHEIRQDLILNMIDGKNVQYVNKKIPSFPELVKVLSHFCQNPDPDDQIAFDAAVLLGKLCVLDENAKARLLRSLNHTSDTHVKAKALETLVKQLSSTSWDVVQHLLELFQKSSVWKYRALAADLLIVLGKEHVCRKGEEGRIYHILERKLWDDPNKEVRVSAAKALAALGMFSKACERIEKRLEDLDEDIRAQAVISVGTLEMKNEKIIRLLLEMLELDPSEYVRLMIARSFTILKLTDKRVMRALRERDKVEGALARSFMRDLTKRIKESVKSSGVLGRARPAYNPYRPEVYGVPRISPGGDNSALYSCSDRLRLLNLIGHVLD